MVEEPSNWELGRRIDQIYGAVQALIGRAEYVEFQRALEHRFTEIAQAMTEIRRDQEAAIRARDAAIRELHARITAESKTAAARSQWRASLAAGLLPVLVAVAAILVEIWLHGTGKG